MDDWHDDLYLELNTLLTVYDTYRWEASPELQDEVKRAEVAKANGETVIATPLLKVFVARWWAHQEQMGDAWMEISELVFQALPGLKGQIKANDGVHERFFEIQYVVRKCWQPGISSGKWLAAVVKELGAQVT